VSSPSIRRISADVRVVVLGADVYIKNIFEPKFYKECVLDRLPLARHTRTVYRRDAENARRFAIEMKPRLGLGHSVPVNDTNRVFQKVRSVAPYLHW